MKSTDGRFRYLDKDGEDLPDGTPFEKVGQFEFVCRSLGGHCSVNLHPTKNAGYPNENRQWILTGTLNLPTLSPSINCRTGDEGEERECWHGYIQKGRFNNTNGDPEPVQ